MAKPARQPSYGVGVFLDDAQVNRVTAFGSTGNKNYDDVTELGRLGIVEVVEDLPTIDATLDTNEYGSTQLEGTFTSKGWGCKVWAVPSGTAVGSQVVKVTAGVAYINDIPIAYSGTTSLAVPSASGNYVVSLNYSTLPASAVVTSGTTPPAGNIALAALTAVPSGGPVVQNLITDQRPWKEITLDDFELNSVDIIVPTKPTITSDITRTMYLEDLFVNRLDTTFSVGANATVTCGFEGNIKRWYLNSGKYIIGQVFRATAAQTTFELTQIPTQRTDGSKTIKVIKNGIRLKEGVDFTVSGTTLTLTQAATAGDLLYVRYCSSTGGLSFQPNPATNLNVLPELRGALRHGNIEVYLSDNTTNIVERLQSVRLGIPIRREMRQELGHWEPYARPATLPIESTVAIETIDSDLELWARLAGKTYDPVTGVDSSVAELSLEDLLANKDLIIKVYRLNDKERAKLSPGHPDTYPLKIITCKSLIPSREANESRTGADTTQTFDFRCFDMRIAG